MKKTLKRTQILLGLLFIFAFLNLASASISSQSVLNVPMTNYSLPVPYEVNVSCDFAGTGYQAFDNIIGGSNRWDSFGCVGINPVNISYYFGGRNVIAHNLTIEIEDQANTLRNFTVFGRNKTGSYLYIFNGTFDNSTKMNNYSLGNVNNDSYQEILINISNTYGNGRLFISRINFIQENIPYIIDFNAVTTEGATETFSLNYTKNESKTVSKVELFYENVSYSFPYVILEGNVFSEGTITIPSKNVSSIANFYFNVTFTDSTHFITDSNFQTINVLNIDNCTTYTNLAYNFTQLDEATKQKINNNTMEVQVNIYNTFKTVLLLNFSQKFENVDSAEVCFENVLSNTVNYSSYVVVKYYGNDTITNKTYVVEYYNTLNETLNGLTVPKNVSLFSLNQADSTPFLLTFRDNLFTLAPNVLVQVHRQYVEDNDFKIVEVPLTDTNGQTILNLVRDSVVYNFVVVDEAGTVLATFNSFKVFCQDFTIGSCTLNLNAPTDSEQVFNREEAFGISISNITYNNNTELVSLSFITDDLLPKTVSMEVVRNNDFGNRSVCTNSITASTGILTCDVSAVVDTDQFLFIDIYVDGVYYSKETINLNPTGLSFGLLNGAFYAFLLILFIITLFTDDKRMLLISLGIGWILVIGLGLVNDKIVGIATGGVWLIISIALMLWKLNKEDIN